MHANIYLLPRWRRNWLPASSEMSVRTLNISGSSAVRLPEGMYTLEHLNKCACKHLFANWLPSSSGAAVRTPDIESSPQPLEHVPAGAIALQCLSACRVSCLGD